MRRLLCWRIAESSGPTVYRVEKTARWAALQLSRRAETESENYPENAACVSPKETRCALRLRAAEAGASGNRGLRIRPVQRVPRESYPLTFREPLNKVVFPKIAFPQRLKPQP